MTEEAPGWLTENRALVEMIVTSFIVPVLVRLVTWGKQMLTDQGLPGWVLPLLAGIGGELIGQLGMGLPGGSGALAGMAGVGMRELQDQGRKRIAKAMNDRV